MKNKVYLDYNATSPLRDTARKALVEAHDSVLNASASHSFGRQGRAEIEKARTIVAKAVNCPPAQLIFNSGATEGNNTVLQHFAREYPNERILIGATEHTSVAGVVDGATAVPVDKNGVIDLAALEALLIEKPRVCLVSVMLANNETGAIQPMKEIAALAHRHGALVHSDAIQALGKIPLDMQALGIDFLTISAHKNGGTQGSGALALGLCGITPILLHGGGQEKKARGGTENISGIMAFGAACTESMAGLDAEHQRLSALKKKLEDGILKISPEAVIFSRDVERLANTTMFSIASMKAETIVMAFDLDGIAISNGSACSSGTVKASSVLTSMGVDPELATGGLRISTGWKTQDSDIDQFLEVWERIYARQKR